MDEEKIKTKITFREKLKNFWAKPKNRKIVIFSTTGFAIVAIATGVYFILRPDPSSNLDLDVKKDEPVLYPSILDGTKVDQESANRHPLGIMVENHLDARPQSGLSAASLIYEAIAESGITRFLAIYSPRGSEKIGPVRSARTYYVDWVRELSGYYAHVGGNYDALQKIKSDGVFDLDQFTNPSAYWRDNSKKVSSEHTMYASSTKLYRIASDKKYSTANSFSLYKFKAEQALELRPVAQTVSINFGNVNYNVEYKYDSANNQYNREQAGKPHIDAETNTQLTTKNVVVMIVKRSSTVTAIDEQGWTMQTIGSGEASVFQDGVEIKATWKKDNENARTHFFNKTTGIEIEFNAGPSWIEVISPDLTYGTK